MQIMTAPHFFGVFVSLGLALGVSAAAPPPATREYDLCLGQDGPVDPKTSRTGPMTTQLAPALLDKMNACEARDKAPPADLAVKDAGTVNAEGDCVWLNKVSCHYHLGVEFVSSNDAARPKLGELHCIFPTTDDSPEVFGGHFTCTEAPAAAPVEGAACGEGLLPELVKALSGCWNVRCCDDGTLTGTTQSRTEKKKLSVRPDFHICATTMALDCRALANLHGHSANAPKYGDPVATDFALPRSAEAAPAHH
jgi:hypothetical protein